MLEVGAVEGNVALVVELIDVARFQREPCVQDDGSRPLYQLGPPGEVAEGDGGGGRELDLVEERQDVLV